jgi:hypothetical protein
LSDIRSLTAEDIPAVAALFQRTFRNADRAVPDSLARYLRALYLGDPDRNAEIGSRVHVDASGRVTGFVGVLPLRFVHRGEPLRAAIAGSLMVEDRARDPLAGARLLRSVVQGPQDLTFSDTTNVLSQGLWEQLKGVVLPLHSLEWLRVFRPVRAAYAMLTESSPRAALVAPAAWVGERATRPFARRYLLARAPAARVAVESDPPVETLAAAVVALAATVSLRPDWDAARVARLIEEAASKARYGRLRSAIVRGSRGDLLGAYLYHAERGGAGRVLQLLTRPGAAEGVADCLFEEADRAGVAALRGRTTPQTINALMKRRCLFTTRASTVIHSRSAAVLQSAICGDALLTGLAGESWIRTIGDEFR